MAISRLVEPDKTNIKTTEDGCQLGVSDCMYLDSSGNCSAEWCIYSQLPTMVNSGRELTCSICGENTKSVTLYSGVTSYVCPECQEKIKKITKDEKLCSVCGVNNIAVDQYICTDCQQKLIKITKNLSCPICGSSISPGQFICSSCSSKIKEKINE